MRISDWSSDVCSYDLGMRITRLGKRHPSEPVVKSSTPYGDPVNWIGPVGRVSDSADDTDFGAVARHAVSSQPLRIEDRKSVRLGKSVYVRVTLGGRRLYQKKLNNHRIIS